MVEPECVWDLGAELGEGPVWFENRLWFVDIKQHKIHRFDPADGSRESWDAPAPPGFIAPLDGGDFIAGLKTGLHRFDPASGAFTLMTTVEPDRPGNRLNDGAVDRKGRLWFGSMDDGETEATGRLYRLETGGPAPVDEGYVITNGPAFSPDGRTLYHTDTLERVTFAFDLDEKGAITNKRLFIRYAETDGYPDGPTVDAEGCVWISFFFGWGVRRYSPKGEMLRFVRFPCSNVTKIAFGGDDLATAYATTAWKGLRAKDREEQPLAGGLFSFAADAPGLAQMTVRHG